MIFHELQIKGAYVIDLDRREDPRGFFARAWCQREFEQQDLIHRLAQCNISFNLHRGTLRGLHYQVAPHSEVKLVRCTRGAIFDVLVDLRQDSHTFRQWQGLELTADNYRMLYVPEGFAHGYQTLVDNAEVFYQVSEFYHPAAERGLRWDDPAFGVQWPIPDPIISDKDRGWPLFGENKG
jgi:dTDP-4-dehydrorhamnose 3,5-epimerase